MPGSKGLNLNKEFPMSFYCQYEGTVTFKKEEEYLNFKKRLIEGGWATENDWIDEMGGKFSSDTPPFNDTSLSVTFAGYSQRNLHRAVDTLIEKYEWEGILAGYSTDGCFSGWILQGGQQVIYNDLEEWASLKGLDPKPSDPDEEMEWQEYVADDYLAEAFRPANSVDFMNKES
jgi:hypothetical protein